MSKNRNRNKKIKKRCLTCNKKNTFAKENWKGAENTNCKYCGSKLNVIKTYEPSITNQDQLITKQDKPIIKTEDTESFCEATKPSINLYKKKSKMKTYIMCSIAIIFILAIGFTLDNRDKNTLEKVLTNLNKSNNPHLIPPTTQELCSEINKVPAWCQNGEIISHGYKPEWNVTYLLDNKICFLYSVTCSYCHKQIEAFGDQWETYVLSGYTAECW